MMLNDRMATVNVDFCISQESRTCRRLKRCGFQPFKIAVPVIGIIFRMRFFPASESKKSRLNSIKKIAGTEHIDLDVVSYQLERYDYE
jgi:hypothetical protein